MVVHRWDDEDAESTREYSSHLHHPLQTYALHRSRCRNCPTRTCLQRVYTRWCWQRPRFDPLRCAYERVQLSTDPSTPTTLVSLPVVDTIDTPDADDVPKAANGEEEKEDLLLIA